MWSKIDLGVEALGVLLEARHEIRPLHAVGVGRPVVDFGGGHELAALGEAGDQHGREVGARCVYCGGVAGRAGAQDDEAGVLGGHRGLVFEWASQGEPSLAHVGAPPDAVQRRRPARLSHVAGPLGAAFLERIMRSMKSLRQARCFSIVTTRQRPARRGPAIARCRRASPGWSASPGCCWSWRSCVFFALILATLQPGPTRLVVHGQRHVRRQPAAAPSARGWPTSCSTSSALSAWWWVVGGVVLVVGGFRRVFRPDDERDHPLSLRVAGLRARAPRERGAGVDPAVAAWAAAALGRRAARSASCWGRAPRMPSDSTVPRCCCSRCSRWACRCSSASRGCA